MTVTATRRLLPLDVEAEAVDLIRELCRVAGDDARVVAALARTAREHGDDLEHLRRTCAAALLLTYTRCLPGPVPTPPRPATAESDHGKKES